MRNLICGLALVAVAGSGCSLLKSLKGADVDLVKAAFECGRAVGKDVKMADKEMKVSVASDGANDCVQKYGEDVRDLVEKAIGAYSS